MRAFLHAPRADQWSSSGHTAGYRMPCDPPNPAHPVTSTTRLAGSVPAAGTEIETRSIPVSLYVQLKQLPPQVEATSVFRPLDAAIKQSPKAYASDDEAPRAVRRRARIGVSLRADGRLCPAPGLPARPGDARHHHSCPCRAVRSSHVIRPFPKRGPRASAGGVSLAGAGLRFVHQFRLHICAQASTGRRRRTFGFAR